MTPLLLLALFAAPPNQPFVVAGYLPSYRVAAFEHPAADVLTDLIYFQITPTADGGFESPLDATLVQRAVTLAGQHNARLSVCIGGWGKSDAFADMIADDDARSRFVNQIALLRVDGFDFDWEYPRNQSEWNRYAEMIRELKAIRTDAVISVAVASTTDITPTCIAVVDRVHLMSYDHRFPQSTREKTTRDIDHLLALGCPPDKLVVGIPFYGRDADRQAKAYRQLGTVSGDLSSEGYAFNSIETVRAKVRQARDRGLAGVMIWELSHDRTDARSLLRAIAAERDASTEN